MGLEITKVFSRDRSPFSSLTSDLETPKVLARKSMHSRFASPSTGGELMRIFSLPRKMPEISLLEALG
jgi:hypothetical protein